MTVTVRKWTPRTCEVDLSEYTDPPIICVLQELDIKGQFAAGADVEHFQQQFPDWDARQCAVVAEYAASHVSPDVGPPGAFYAALASDSRPAFTAVMHAYKEAFPDQGNLQKATETVKNA